jgi:hypothetical protein
MSNTFWLYILLLGGVLIGFGVRGFVDMAFGEEFHFNMTKQLNDETRLLQICIETEIKIPNCEILYGGVNTTYGEKIK